MLELGFNEPQREVFLEDAELEGLCSRAGRLPIVFPSSSDVVVGSSYVCWYRSFAGVLPFLRSNG